MDFKKINDQIQCLIKDFKKDWYSLDDKEFKLPFSDAIFCCEDIVRNKIFYNAIKKAIIDLKKTKEKVKVIDAWSWTWILWIFALFLWADNCLFIEDNPHSLDLNKKLIKNLWFESKANFILWDAITTKLDDKYDLLISETISIDFTREDFLEIVCNLKNYLNKDSVVIPESFELYISENNWAWESLTTKKVSFTSKSDLVPVKVIASRKDVENYEISWKAVLYKDEIIKSWDCMSFFNKKVISWKKWFIIFL